MSFLKLLDKYLICALLTAVVVFQLYNSQFDSLNPWKGGGFGMFSTNKKNNITAIGYTSDGDSVLIKIVSSKLNLPISKNFLTNLKYYPTESGLIQLGELILNSALKPSSLDISKEKIDSKSFRRIEQDSIFYSKIYIPKHYSNCRQLELDEAIYINRVVLHLYEMNFYNEDLIFKKTYKYGIELKKNSEIVYVSKHDTNSL